MLDGIESSEVIKLLWILPVAGALLIVGELLHALATGHAEETHDRAETAGSVGIAAIDFMLRPLLALVMLAPILWLYQYRLFDIPWNSVPLFIGLVFLVDFMNYWFHRASHRIRALWTVHVVHHSSRTINLTAAIRLSWMAPTISSIYWFIPLALLGFHPLIIVIVVNGIEFYQFALHTARTPSWGPLEWFMVTPRHHRIHHAINPTCIDKNFGATLIIWDKLFGTFAVAPKGEKLVYGLLDPINSQNPFVIIFREPIRLIRDLRHTSGLRRRLRALMSYE